MQTKWTAETLKDAVAIACKFRVAAFPPVFDEIFDVHNFRIW